MIQWDGQHETDIYCSLTDKYRWICCAYIAVSNRTDYHISFCSRLFNRLAPAVRVIKRNNIMKTNHKKLTELGWLYIYNNSVEALENWWLSRMYLCAVLPYICIYGCSFICYMYCVCVRRFPNLHESLFVFFLFWYPSNRNLFGNHMEMDILI